MSAHEQNWEAIPACTQASKQYCICLQTMFHTTCWSHDTALILLYTESDERSVSEFLRAPARWSLEKYTEEGIFKGGTPCAWSVNEYSSLGGAVESGFEGGVLFTGNLVAVVLCGSSTCKLEVPIAGGVCVDSWVGLGGAAVLLSADGIWVGGRAERYSSTNRDEVKVLWLRVGRRAFGHVFWVC